jgi:hypothetical protein
MHRNFTIKNCSGAAIGDIKVKAPIKSTALVFVLLQLLAAGYALGTRGCLHHAASDCVIIPNASNSFS